MPLTPSIKIAIGWAAIISVGLTGFIMARDLVVQNRRSLMETRQRIRDQAQVEGEQKFHREERQ